MTNSDIAVIREMLAARPRPAGLAERRQRLDALGDQFPVSADIIIEPVDAGGVPAEWTASPGADHSRVLVFLHGGGYVSGSIASHRHMVSEAGREASVRTLALDYRLAPEHPFPAALDDAVAAYRFLREEGFEPRKIALGGESAGGGLAVATLVSLREMGLDLPACLWCSSPWTDLEMTGASMQTRAAVDPIIQKPYLQELAAAYLQGADPRAPKASPIHAELRGLPPMLIQIGSSETLLDDAVRLAAVAGAAEVPVTLRIWPEMIHGFQLFHPLLEDGRKALQEVGAFIRTHLGLG